MPKKKPNLTAPMRRVLERAEKGVLIFACFGVPVWGDTGKYLTIPEQRAWRESGILLYVTLLKQEKANGHWTPFEFYRITPAGRRALQEKG